MPDFRGSAHHKPGTGTGNFLVKATTIAAVIFFVTSLSLAIIARSQSGVGATTGLPVVNNPELLEETTSTQSDLPGRSGATAKVLQKWLEPERLSPGLRRPRVIYRRNPRSAGLA